MKRSRPSDVKAILAERAIRPNRVLGQNFLVDQNILAIILTSAHLARTDTVLEIGPGLGVVTERLLDVAGRVVAVEKDPSLAEYLHDTLGPAVRLQLITADALELDLPALLRDEKITHVVSNLPYSAGTRILMEIMAADARPLRLVVMLQLDVAERLIAAPGSKAYGTATIFTQLYYDVWLRKVVSPTCFYPPPDVRSAIVEFYRRAEPVAQPDNTGCFRDLVRWCFSQRRKQIGHILAHAPQTLAAGTDPAILLQAAGCRPDQRPETIAVREWVALANALYMVRAN